MYAVVVMLVLYLFLNSRTQIIDPINEAPRSLYQLDKTIINEFEISITDVVVPEFNPVTLISPREIGGLSASVYYFDEEYSVLSSEQLFTFIEWWKIFLIKNRITYLENNFDCDNFSNLFKSLLFLTNKNQTENAGQILVGLAIVKQNFEFAYIPSGCETWHMLNIVLTDTGWYMVEPQNGMYIHIDYYPNQILSIYF